MIAITGAHGFIGSAVCRALELRGFRLLRIGRRDADVHWPGRGAEFGPDALEALGRVRAVVHLAGETIGARWTPRRRQAIRESRAGLTATLARALAALDRRPVSLVAASAVGVYGDRGDEWLDESSAPGDDFLASVVREWEAASAPASAAGIRASHLRFGIVLGAGGGMLSQLRLPFQLALGARLGRGTQWMSWISIDDLVRFVVRAIDDPAAVGPVNVVSPSPARNAEFTQSLARALGRPAPFVAPAFALRAMFGEMADGLMLSSQRVRPARLLAMGFTFEHPSLDDALHAALGR